MIFSPQEFKKYLRTRPFRPFRIVTTANETYDVYHPDLMMVTQRYLMIGTATSDSPEFADMVDSVPIAHVSRVGTLPIPAAPVATEEVAG